MSSLVDDPFWGVTTNCVTTVDRKSGTSVPDVISKSSTYIDKLTNLNDKEVACISQAFAAEYLGMFD
jgi:hypothetical protein